MNTETRLRCDALLKQLRDDSGDWLTDLAADRIEELEAKLRQEVKDKERVDRVWAENYAALEAKLEKAVETLSIVALITEDTDDE